MTRILTVLFFLALAAPAAAQNPTIEKGKQVYAAQKCQVCHSVGSVGNKKGALDDVGARLKVDDIRQWIVAAPEMTAKTNSGRKPPMKSYTLPKEDLDSLVTYLASMKK